MTEKGQAFRKGDLKTKGRERGTALTKENWSIFKKSNHRGGNWGDLGRKIRLYREELQKKSVTDPLQKGRHARGGKDGERDHRRNQIRGTRKERKEETSTAKGG